MFTGIIQRIGRVRKVTPQQLVIETDLTAQQHSRVGDSVAVNGICLTVTTLTRSGFTADIMPETLQRTNLGDVQANGHVNLELALQASDRFDGHFVLGHVDTTATLASRQPDGNAERLTFTLASAYRPYVVEKGSIAVDGVSLTVTAVTRDSFSVSLIPHTLAKTVLGELVLGQRVNIETDILGKYMVHQQEVRDDSNTD